MRTLAPVALLAALIVAGPALALAGAEAGPETEAPRRVVSINLCTDQLAMMLAAPGQLVSVSWLARDPRSSTMPEAAARFPVNNGLAEEVYLLKPDLVLAGRFTARASVEMLERLGIPVAIFDPAYSLADVRRGMIEMGAALGREEAAAAMVRDWDARLAALPPARAPRPAAATYAANGYTAGSRSLAGEIVEAAGLRHLADELGLPQGGMLPLEVLVMADPDLVITGTDEPGHARAEELLEHPAFKALSGGRTAVEDRDWVCGLPAVLDAVERLSAERLGARP